MSDLERATAAVNATDEQKAELIRVAESMRPMSLRDYPFCLPVLDHDHDWVDTTVLEDDGHVEICAAGGCTATRKVLR